MKGGGKTKQKKLILLSPLLFSLHTLLFTYSTPHPSEQAWHLPVEGLLFLLTITPQQAWKSTDHPQGNVLFALLDGVKLAC